MYGLIQTQIRRPLSLQPAQHALRVGEGPRVPLEVAPVELAHPEAVEVEDADSGRSRSAMPSTNAVTVSSS